MFSNSIQPSLVSLFSSTSSDPLQLFSVRTDSTLPADSIVYLLHDATSQPTPPPPATLIPSPPDFSLDQTVLHIQSPTLSTTYICCPPPRKDRLITEELGLRHTWLHLQVRNMAHEWSFEVGLVDRAGRQGILRCSTFQKQPRLTLRDNSSPLLHVPLAFPATASRPLSSWSTIALHLPSFLPHFSSSSLFAREQSEDGSPAMITSPVPAGQYSHAAHLKIYATCRLRRVWFSNGDSSGKQKLPWEFELYSSSDVESTGEL